MGIIVNKVYPRVYGGTFPIFHGHHRQRGLSPRVRGNLPTLGCRLSGQRSIPACTGEPHKQSTVSTADSAPVYPRVYGGTLSQRATLKAGLPEVYPRVYGGTPSMVFSVPTMTSRSIPACTGEPSASCSQRPSGYRGLSPRVRGNPLANNAHGSVGRSIPACTGEP